MKDISSPAKKKLYQFSIKPGEFYAIIGGKLQLFSTPERSGTRNTQPSGSTQNPPTPKIIVLFKNGNNIKIGCLGKLKILNNKTDLYEVLRDKKNLAPNINTCQDSTLGGELIKPEI